MKAKWKCSSCGKEYISDSTQRHHLDMCECGKSGIDLEEYYCRVLGDITDYKVIE